jgi:hypothetical protein
VVDTDGPIGQPSIFDIFHTDLPFPTACTDRSAKKQRDVQTCEDACAESSARVTFEPTRPSPRACIAADWPPLMILTSLPDLVGGQRPVATIRAFDVLTPALLDRSIGIAAAQAIAFTTSDPAARTPPWTLQSNPRRCVVDTDGQRPYRAHDCGFQGPRINF